LLLQPTRDQWRSWKMQRAFSKSALS
jgi:hypothetical protein